MRKPVTRKRVRVGSMSVPVVAIEAAVSQRFSDLPCGGRDAAVCAGVGGVERTLLVDGAGRHAAIVIPPLHGARMLSSTCATFSENPAPLAALYSDWFQCPFS